MSFETVQIGDCTLILGDCLEVLPTLSGVDAVVTDPPYGINRDGMHESTGSHGERKAYEFLGWDNAPPSSEIFEWIFANSDHQIIWGANYFTKYLPPSMGWLFWDKGQRICSSDGELAFTSFDKALRVITLNRVEIAKDGAVHPTQKPVSLMTWCVSLIPASATTILDPFMGSGTTGVACVKMGRKFVGIEKERKYFDIACKRIREAELPLLVGGAA
jgi:DNA modification methylase